MRIARPGTRPLRPARGGGTGGAIVRRAVLLAVALGGLAGATPPAAAVERSTPAAAPAPSPVDERYGRIPLHFEPNHGQVDGAVQFVARGRGYVAYLTATETVITLARPRRARPQPSAPGERAEGSVVPLRLRLVGGRPPSSVRAEDPLPGRVNYLVGNHPARWHTDLPTYGRVVYEGVYAGIDLVHRGTQRQLEQDFVVAPGADPDVIALAFEGAAAVRVEADGALSVQAGGTGLRLLRPTVYQEIDGERRIVQAGYRLLPGETGAPPRVGFQVAAYDAARPLVIDPIIYAGFLGGSGDDAAFAVAVDGDGNAYVTGRTASLDFPVFAASPGNPPGQPFLVAGYDAFVTKVGPTGLFVYSTYFGGSGYDEGTAIAVDAFGNAHLAGFTTSLDLPVTFTAVLPDAPGFNTGFATKLNATGSAMFYSTYLGGADVFFFGFFFPTVTAPRGIAVDGAGRMYVSGIAGPNFPTTFGSAQPFFAGGDTDIFLAKLNPFADGAASLVYATYIGGSANEGGLPRVAVDGQGRAHVAGATASPDFPVTVGAFQTVLKGPADAFAVKVAADGASFVYSTLLGGEGEEQGGPIALDGNGNVYLTGYTLSSTFPLVLPIQPTPVGLGRSVFVTKLNPTGTALGYSTLAGGSGSVTFQLVFDPLFQPEFIPVQLFDYGQGIAVDGSGNAYVTGVTVSGDFPTTQNALQQTSEALPDAFLLKLDRTGTILAFSTYLGGNTGFAGTHDAAFGIAVDPDRNAYIVGQAVDPFSGVGDGFVAKFSATGMRGPLHLVQFPAVFPALPTAQRDAPYTGNLGIGGGDPDAPYTVTVTGLPQGLATGSPTITGTPLAAGSFLMNVQVTNTTETLTQQVELTVEAGDITPPQVAITSPSPAGTFQATASALTLQGNASDNVGVTQVSWQNDRGGTGNAVLSACQAGTCWSAAGIPLRGGLNVITVTARDAAGIQRTTTLKVMFFTDTMQAGVTIKAVHFTELLEAINVLRARVGLAAAAFSGAAETRPAPGRAVRASHFNDLRQALVQVCEQISCAGAGAVPTAAVGGAIGAGPLEGLRSVVRLLN